MEKLTSFFSYACLILAGWCYSIAISAATLPWQTLKEGLEYTSLSTPPISSYGKLHAFRIDPKHYELDLVSAQEYAKLATKVYFLARNSNALLAINGGFFDPEFSPLGLRIKQGKITNPLKAISWWGIFMIKNGHAQIVPPDAFHNDKAIHFAVQSGPRLVVNGSIPTLKPGIDERSALCITQDGKVIILATENAPLTTTQLATLIKESANNGGLGCYNALNLDGGSSTQLYAAIGDFTLNIFSFHDVADGIVVKKKG